MNRYPRCARAVEKSPPSAIRLANEDADFLTSGVESTQLSQYVPVLLLGLVAVAFAGGTLLVSVLVGFASKRSKIKDTAYECGMLPRPRSFR